MSPRSHQAVGKSDQGSARRNLVIFDSSFLMAVSERPTSWFEDMTELIGKFEPVLLDCVREELERLGTEGGKSRFAKVALELGSTFQRAACGGGRVDDEIVSAASSMHAMVATADRELEISLKALRVGTVMLRSGRVYLP